MKASKLYAHRYSDQWAETSRLTRELTHNRCCYPLCNRRATCAHHATVKKPWVPLENIFPLCDRHHGVDEKTHRKLPLEKVSPDAAHHPDNWFVGTKVKGYRDARNTDEYIARLKFGVSLILG